MYIFVLFLLSYLVGEGGCIMGSYAEVILGRQSFPSLGFQTFLSPNTASFSNHSFKGLLQRSISWMFLFPGCVIDYLFSFFTEQTDIGCIIYYYEFHSHQQIVSQIYLQSCSVFRALGLLLSILLNFQ